MDQICRVCMETSGALTNIFDETQEWDTCIADMISDYTGYVVRRGDSLPENICPPCLEDAVSAFNLKKICEQSHKLYFARMEEDKEEEICDNVDWKPSDSESERSNQFKPDAKGPSDKDVNRRFKCSLCPKSYAHKSNLTRHKQLHTEDRPFKCSDCLKSFKLKYHLQGHIRTHTSDRSFQCCHCSKSFKQKKALQQHNRTHTGQPFKCSHCPMSFKTRYYLKKHLQERTYKCSYCIKSFSDKSKYRRHNRYHTAKRAYPCNLCSMSFITESSLRVHMCSHTGGNPYKCPQCSKTFKYKKKTYKRHLLTHTSNNKSSR
ncbi:zinc finger protein 525-like [Drosophila obscura]|uniref:zinc finger protein 525-like n=1 Tax=Drosophila obscura TaxID=7282 RepID=UPI001BB2C9E6|nr:zinc finger protein 525-like [Drosophila obscura]